MHNKRISLTLLSLSALMLSSCFGGNTSGHKAPVIHYGADKGAGSIGMHTVVRNENIWRISKNYAIPMQELIVKNSLEVPYILQVGQRLEMPPPRQYTVKKGDTIYEIARLFSLSMSKLVRQNGLKAPYRIREGQVLQLPMSYEVFENNRPAARQKEQYVHMQVPSSRPTQATARPTNAVKPKGRGSKHIKTKIPERAGSKFNWPIKGQVLSSYGSKGSGYYNDGINIRAARGAAVKAAENGVIVYTGDEISGYGNLVLVKHTNGWISAYAHLDKIKAVKGTQIKRGQVLGTVGSTGNVTSPQLHFELRKGAKTQNPLKYLG